MAFDSRSDGPADNPYAPLMGRTYVGLDETADITILDAARVQTLSAWVGRIIPGNEHWPSADELDTVGYIDAVLKLAPELRPVILAGIDAAEAIARREHRASFTEIPDTAKTAVLVQLERAEAREAFSVILELTYEAYYRTERVLAITKERTGFDITRTVQGAPIKPFDTERLTRVSLMPNRYRSAS